MATLSIAIAGAGIGGLAAAAALAQDGHDVRVFDRFSAPQPVGSGLVIQPVGQAVLAAVGALDAADALGQRISRLVGHEADGGRAILDVTYDLRGQGRRHGLAIHRAALFQALLDAATAAGVEIVPDHEVTAITEGKRRSLTFANGALAGPFDLIIDASGTGSPLSPLKARDLPYGAIWGTVDWPEDTPLPETQLSQLYRSAHHMLGALPVGQLPGGGPRKAAIFWSLPRNGLAAWQAASIDTWKDEAAALWPEFEKFTTSIKTHTDMVPAFYSHGTLRNPVAEGLVHIGDAAHRASPQLGQGANMALLDALALRKALREKSDLQDALTQYWRNRRWHLKVYQLMSALFTPLYQSDSRVLPMLRDHILTPLAKTPPMPAILSRLIAGNLVTPIKGCGLLADGRSKQYLTK